MARKQPSMMDDYLSGLETDKKLALEQLRKILRRVMPEAEEGVSYGLPAFLVNSKAVAAFSASKDHCSYFPMSGRVVAAMGKELRGFSTSKGTIRFTPRKPLPTALVSKAVRLRLAEIEAKENKKTRPLRLDPGVTLFLKTLKHPLKADIEKVRKTILRSSSTIREGIKWNSMSFRTSEWFATLNWRCRDAVQLVFHLGARVKDHTKDVKITDPENMIDWLAKDRCLVTLSQGNTKALANLVKQWIRYV